MAKNIRQSSLRDILVSTSTASNVVIEDQWTGISSYTQVKMSIGAELNLITKCFGA